MKIIKDPEIDEIADLLLEGGTAVVRTDTLYGLVACADNQRAVERVFDIKKRSIDKQCIVLVASSADMWDEKSEKSYESIAASLPSDVATSVIVPVGHDTPEWIHRGGQDVAFRIPATIFMHELLLRTGPLIAPSANPEGQPPAQSINQAVDYFGEDVEMYVDGGFVDNVTPSRLVRFAADGKLERLR